MDTPITRAEHEEFVRRMESENKRLADEDKRQNHRLDELEKAVMQISSLASSTERLATNMENMLKVQTQQGERLDRLESHDGEMWRSVVGYVITTIVGIIIWFVCMQIGIQ